jgi:hypothetical protein
MNDAPNVHVQIQLRYSNLLYIVLELEPMYKKLHVE